VEQGHSTEANCPSSSQQIPRFFFK